MKPASGDRSREFKVREASWSDPGDRAQLMEVRTTVFVVEQKVPQEIEIDDEDPNCLHVLATDSGSAPIGTARLDGEGHVGRVAVMRPWRRRGVGSALMNELIEVAKSRGRTHLELNSQVSATAFYQTLGFTIDPGTEEFEEAGIPHRKMVLVL